MGPRRPAPNVAGHGTLLQHRTRRSVQWFLFVVDKIFMEETLWRSTAHKTSIYMQTANRINYNNRRFWKKI